MLGTLSHTEMEEVLHNNFTGRIGCSNGAEIYVVPISYVYDDGCIIAHSREGKKIEFMRSNPRVCFEVDEMQNLTNWKSVIAQGYYEELTDEVERYEAMKKLVTRTLKLKLSASAKPPHLDAERVHPHQPGSIQAIVFKIHLQNISGRFEKE
jgi:uncharacterized protein